jgi:mRNA interferase MazF
MICDSWDVVVTPFPFTEGPNAKRRPALVLSPEAFNQCGYTLLAMITTADQSHWPGDAEIQHEKAGLKHACVVRMKLFTLDSRLIIRKVGNLADADRTRVAKSLALCLPAIKKNAPES